MAKSPTPVAAVDPVADAKRRLETLQALRRELCERLTATLNRNALLHDEQRGLAPAKLLSNDAAASKRLDAIRAELANVLHDETEIVAAREALDVQIADVETEIVAAEQQAALDEGAAASRDYMDAAKRIDTKLAELNDEIELLWLAHRRIAAVNHKLGPAGVVLEMLWRQNLLAEAAVAAGQGVCTMLGVQRLKAAPQCEPFASRVGRILSGLLRRADDLKKAA